MIDVSTILPKLIPDDVSKWLEENIYFSAEVSPNNPGNLSFEAQPWMRGILNQLLSPYSKEVTLCCGAQLGKSTLCLLATLLLLEFRGGQMLWLLPTDKMATRAVKKRIMPLLACNPHFAAYLPHGNYSTADSIPLKGMPIYYTGVRNPSKVASLPANVLILDEAAKFEKIKANEADPISLAKERIKSFADSLVISASTPNVPENKFWQSYKEGTQSKYWMPCPHCGEFMVFEWGRDNVQWDNGKPQTARIICPHCKSQIDESQRKEMMQHGEWRDENTEARKLGKISYHLNSLYSPYVSIAEMAQKYHDACHSLTPNDDLRNFINSWLALPYEEHVSKIYDSDITALIDPMSHKGSLPLDYKLLVMGVDIGQNQSHYVVTAIKTDGQLQVVDWGTVVNYKTENGLDGIASLFDSLTYTDNAGNVYRPDLCLIDSGYDTTGVYEECMRASCPGTIIPVKGSNGRIGAWGKSKIRTLPDAPFELILFSDFQVKRALYLDAVKGRKLVLPSETDDALLQGLSGQEMVKSKTGKVMWKERPSDHYGDALKYAILAHWIVSSEHLT